MEEDVRAVAYDPYQRKFKWPWLWFRRGRWVYYQCFGPQKYIFMKWEWENGTE